MVALARCRRQPRCFLRLWHHYWQRSLTEPSRPAFAGFTYAIAPLTTGTVSLGRGDCVDFNGPDINAGQFYVMQRAAGFRKIEGSPLCEAIKEGLGELKFVDPLRGSIKLKI